MANILALIGFGSTLVGIGQVIYIYLKNNKREKRCLSAFYQQIVLVMKNGNFIKCAEIRNMQPKLSDHL